MDPRNGPEVTRECTQQQHVKKNMRNLDGSQDGVFDLRQGYRPEVGVGSTKCLAVAEKVKHVNHFIKMRTGWPSTLRQAKSLYRRIAVSLCHISDRIS